MVHRAGFEPATSRVIGEVTEIFTTDRDGVGGERSMLLLPLRAIRLSARRARTCSALSRLHHEVTDIFTTARPMLSHRPLMGTLGNRRYRLFGMATKSPSTADSSAERVSRRRNSSPLFHRVKYSISSPPASVEPRSSRQTELRKFYRGAVDAPHLANPLGSLCHRCPALASFPPAGPARLGTRLPSASPEIRVSRSGHGRVVRLDRAAGNKKPSGAAGSGGSVRSGRSILRSGKIAPMSRACDIE